MRKKRNLLKDLGLEKDDLSQYPPNIDTDKIKSIVFNNIKEAYGMKRTVKRVKLKWASGIAAGLCAACILTLNIYPALAAALGDVPVIGQIVRVVTFGRYEAAENGYRATIVTPEIEGLLDKEFEDKLNREFKENAEALILAYENDVKELKKEFGSEEIHMGIDSDYSVKTNNDDILALDVYICNTAGSSSTKHTYYTIDKKTNTLLKLNDLFKANADYVTPISEYIKEQMKYENENNDGLYWLENDEFTESFEKIKDNQSFYINDKGNLVICFDKYEVAAGAQGCPEFIIPDSVIGNIYNR